jgi:hypothetical protein
METWRWRHGEHGEMETWRHGDMDMEIWRYRDMDMETWTCGHMDTWRHGQIHGHGNKELRYWGIQKFYKKGK